MKRLAILGLAALLATPAVGTAQFRPFVVAPVGGLGWPGSFGWPGYGYGWPGFGGYSYPYTFGGMGYSTWPGTGWGYTSPSANIPSTSYSYTIPNVGTPLSSLGGLPARWNGVDLGGNSNQTTYQANYPPDWVITPKSGTLPAGNLPARDRTDTVQLDRRAHIRVRVPGGDPEVTFEGQTMRLTNGAGRFVSPELEPGSRYAYNVRARWTDAAGQRHNEGRSVVVRAGEHVDVSFVPPRR
jgi:uncharacterized protein (TIGR03000 family)